MGALTVTTSRLRPLPALALRAAIMGLGAIPASPSSGGPPEGPFVLPPEPPRSSRLSNLLFFIIGPCAAPPPYQLHATHRYEPAVQHHHPHTRHHRPRYTEFIVTHRRRKVRYLFAILWRNKTFIITTNRIIVEANSCLSADVESTHVVVGERWAAQPG